MGACCNSTTVNSNEDIALKTHKQNLKNLIEQNYFQAMATESVDADFVWRTNYLISTTEVEYLFGGGFYEFEVKGEGEERYEVELLMKSIDNFSILSKIRQLFEVKGPLEYHSNIHPTRQRRVDRTGVTFEGIAESLCGVG